MRTNGILTDIKDLKNIASNLPPKVIIIPGGDRIEDLNVAKLLSNYSFVKKCVLIGNKENMIEAAESIKFDLNYNNIVFTKSDEETAEKTIELIQKNEGDIILKGNISTPVLNRLMLKIKVRDTISLNTLFQTKYFSGGRPMILTDGGFTTFCNIGRFTGIIENAAEVARLVLGINRPKIALLSANEKVIQSLQSTYLEKMITQFEWKDMDVYGPLSFDLATDLESVRIKGFKDEKNVAGNADVLVCPGLDSANILYKVLMSLSEHNVCTTAGITLGVKVPYIILSRADSEIVKINSVALCCIYSERYKSKINQSEEKIQIFEEKKYNILTVNPGSTSIKLALFSNENCIKNFEINKKQRNRLKEDSFDIEVDEYISVINDFLSDNNIKIDVVVGRGGFLNRFDQNIECGVYSVVEKINGNIFVNEDIVNSVKKFAELEHASNLGIPIASKIAVKLGIPAYTVDPVVSDEFCNEARCSGYSSIERKSVSHALSIKRLATKATETIRHPLSKLNLVVVHMGGGITIAAIREGKMVDNNIALLGNGPFTPQRVGSLPMNELIELCYSGKFTKDELKFELTKRGGLLSYLNEDNCMKIEERIKNGDEKARMVMEAMSYQICKEIGAMYVSAGNYVEAIVFSGGLAKSAYFMDLIKKRIYQLGQIIVFPENIEMEAMVLGVLDVLKNKVQPKTYKLKISGIYN